MARRSKVAYLYRATFTDTPFFPDGIALTESTKAALVAASPTDRDLKFDTTNNKVWYSDQTDGEYHPLDGLPCLSKSGSGLSVGASHTLTITSPGYQNRMFPDNTNEVVGSNIYGPMYVTVYFDFGTNATGTYRRVSLLNSDNVSKGSVLEVYPTNVLTAGMFGASGSKLTLSCLLTHPYMLLIVAEQDSGGNLSCSYRVTITQLGLSENMTIASL